jgi:putative aminopeptidase FrvX
VVVDLLTAALPALQDRLAQLPAVNYTDPLWEMLKRLLLAHAPSSGANLLGGIGDDIAVLAEELALRDRVISHLGATGNTAVALGVDKAAADVIVVAHMDRPSFRVRSLDEGTLFPICANRFPPGEYRVGAKAVHFERGRLVVGAEGMLVSRRADGADSLIFEASHGRLAWDDTVLMDVHPTCCQDERVIGTGLDNCVGVLMTLLTAAVLREIEGALIAAGRRCLFVFTDQEEGPPDGFFGHGAARLAYALPSPTYGCIVVDAQNVGPGGPVLGQGVSYSAASGFGRGAVVPPNYHALALDLAAGLNGLRPDTVQLNHGYLSRSDDMILGRWARILALNGPPLDGAHTGQETVAMNDLQNGVWWLSHFLAAALNVVPELAPRYALGR